MVIKIPTELKKEFAQGFDEYIKAMGRRIEVYLEPTKVDCVNCLFDPIQKKSANIYNEEFRRPVNIFPGTPFQQKVYPAPFNVTSVSGVQYDPALADPKILTVSICPVCKGSGILVHDNVISFIGVFTIGKSGNPGFEDLPPGRDGIQYARIKTFSSNYSVCRESKYFIVDGIQYKIEIPARLKGLGSQTITELYLSEVEVTPSISINYDKDPRIQNTDLGNISNQAPISVPTIPPIVPGDDVW
jgi:hypothetical protein